MGDRSILEDLVAEHGALDPVVAGLGTDDWDLLTPSPRWTITDQVGHLTYFDNAAALAISDPDEFDRRRSVLLAATDDPHAVDELALTPFRELSTEDRLSAWRDGRQRLVAAAVGTPDDARIEWYGPSMSLRSFLTARLMETWAHGLDIVDALTDAGVAVDAPSPSDRLRNIAQLGVITRGWSYAVRQLDMPTSEIRVELGAPSGDTWEWGPPNSDQRVAGPAVDFCEVVTQRRHLDDTTLAISGADAKEWMQIAQAFAGAPTDGPAPRGA